MKQMRKVERNHTCIVRLISQGKYLMLCVLFAQLGWSHATCRIQFEDDDERERALSQSSDKLSAISAGCVHKVDKRNLFYFFHRACSLVPVSSLIFILSGQHSPLLLQQ